MFDLDVWRGQDTAWGVSCRGRRYVARQLSARRMAAFVGEVERAADAASVERAVEALLREAFPRRLSMRWRGDPVRAILELPLLARREALGDFFVAQGIDRASIPAILWRWPSKP